MSWYSTIFYKDPEWKALKDKKKKLQINIYNKNMTYAEHAKKFHIIHYFFKYKFLVPAIRLGNLMLGKHIIKKVPKTSENRNLIILDKAFDDAIDKWYIYYIRNSGDPTKRKSKREMLKQSKKNEILRSMKNYIITMYLYDTAYREFINVLMHEIAHGMVEEYKKPEYKNNSTGHLFFTTDIYDVHYYILEKAIRYQTELKVEDTEKLLQDYYLYKQTKVKK